MQQLQTPSRPLEFPADTLQSLRRLAILTGLYCDRVDAETDFNTREKNYKFALRCIFRIQKTLYENEHAISDKEARAQLAKVSDALFDVWDFLNDRRAFPVSALIGILAGLSIKCVDNFEMYKTSFDCIASEIKQRTR